MGAWVAIFLAPSLIATVTGLALFFALRFDLLYLGPPRSLGEAVMRGSDEAVLRLLSEGADPDLAVSFHHPRLNGGEAFQATPLTIAAAGGNLTEVRLIMEAGADPREPGNERALCASVTLGHGNVQDFLILRGADPNPRPKCDAGRRSPLRIALDLGLDDPAERLKAAGALLDY